MNQAELMDRIYRHQRYIYNMTRKFLLPGRDSLIRQMKIKDNDHVLEIGCGTARNLIHLSNLYPNACLFGLDVSEKMLSFARTKIRRSGNLNLILKKSSAEDFHHRTTFGLEKPFDTIFFSYSLSMIRNWRKALFTAFLNLQPGNAVYILDFWDFRDMPLLVRKFLPRWLALFHVRHEPELILYLESLDTAGCAKLTLMPIFRRYGFMARLSKFDPLKFSKSFK